MVYRQFLVYIIVGVLSAAIDIGTMQILLVKHVDRYAAVSAGFTAGLIFNYLVHQRVTFKAKHSLTAVWRYTIVLLLNYGLTMMCVQLSVAMLDSVLAGKLASLPLVAMVGFILGRYWIFSRPS